MDIKKVIENQKKFFLSGKTKGYKFRKRQLEKLLSTIKHHENDIIEALNKDLGKSEFEAYTTEIGYIYESINYTLKNLKSWMKVEKVKTSITKNFGLSNKIYKDPLGTILIIAPFNYPFQLAIEPLIGAIAAGNTCVIKPSEYTSKTSKLLEEIMNHNFSNEYLIVINGEKEVTTKLLDNKFDHIFFTGSSRVGKIIMKKAADNLTPVTLELGGKSPCIVDETANLESAAKKIIWGKFLNAGQTCIAPDYLLVDEKIIDKLIKYLKETIINFFGKDPKFSFDYGRIVSNRHFDRLIELIDKDKLIHGGDYDKEKLYISPTILCNVNWDDKIMQDEIFGPILPIISYKEFDKIEIEIKKRPKPLSLYLFTNDDKLKDRTLRNISFGGGCINNTLLHINSNKLPFGGVGNSGMGTYHGKFSFDTFTHKKIISETKNNFLDKIIFPPYNKTKLKVIKKILK